MDVNRDSAESLRKLPDLHGHEVHEAYDGEAALEAYERLRPDAVLLDLGLPHLSGLDVCRSIRKSTDGASVLLIAQTGWGQEEERKRSKEAGFDHHFVKPVDAPALLRLLAEPVLSRVAAAGRPA